MAAILIMPLVPPERHGLNLDGIGERNAAHPRVLAHLVRSDFGHRRDQLGARKNGGEHGGVRDGERDLTLIAIFPQADFEAARGCSPGHDRHMARFEVCLAREVWRPVGTPRQERVTAVEQSYLRTLEEQE